MKTGFTSKTGESALPEGLGLFDMTQGADDVRLSPQVEEALHQMYLEEGLENVHAKYKLEVMFTHERSAHRAYPGIVSVLSNGGALHGGGDEAVYLCPARLEGGRGCNSPMDLKFLGKRVAVCPACHAVHEPKNLTGQVFARLTHQNWAVLLLRIFQILNGDADIRIGVVKADMRESAIAAIHRRIHGDRVDKIRREREWVIYPLESIVRDLSTGGDIFTRIRAFLEA